MTRVKICGVSDPADAGRVADLGAWALGMIFWPGSPRACSLAVAEEIGAEQHRRLELVGVFVNASLDEVADTADRCKLTIVQLHGDEGPAYCREVARRTGAKVMKAGAGARRRPGARPAALPHRLPPARRLLAAHAGRHGGDASTGSSRGGTRAPRRWCSRAASTRDNVDAAIEAARPFAVDVASGTEAAPGRKDPAKLTAFLRAVEAADARLGAVA